jgi:hypothetical protein
MDSPLDKVIKSDLIKSTFQLLNVSQNDRKIVKMMEKIEYGKRGRRPEAEQAKINEERQEFYKKYFDQREIYENQNLGDYEKIYPCADEELMENYKTILIRAKTIWIESTSGPSNKKPAKTKSNIKPTTTKKEKSSKKQIMSPFKKIYEDSEIAKLKIKHKSKISEENALIKVID